MEENREKSGQIPVEIPLVSEKWVSTSSSETAKSPKCITDNTLPEELIPNRWFVARMKEYGEQLGQVPVEIPRVSEKQRVSASSSETAKSAKCITDNTLPEELIPNILVRLPVKSLIRFTTVCKSWMSTIKDPSFIRAHLTRNRKNSDDQNAAHLLKPTNRLLSKGVYDDHFCALGYDDVSKDYKVVRLTTDWNEPCGLLTLAQVYSLAKGYWGELHSEILESVSVIPGSMSQAPVNGVLFWLVEYTEYENYSVLTFDVASEAFGELRIPRDLEDDDIHELDLLCSSDGKSIALFETLFREKALEIWVMKDFGVENSWTKVIVLSPRGPERSLPKALCFRSGQVLLVLEDTRELISL